MVYNLTHNYGYSLAPKYRLNVDQRKGLKQLLRLEQSLRSLEPSNSAKGVEGMEIAHQILKDRDSSGVLIGGLAQTVWNQRRKIYELNEHKDVDVVVLNENFELKEKFEEGIDWWLPRQGRINTMPNLGSRAEQNKWWHENGNGVFLSCSMRNIGKLEPGLYIPSPEWILKMKEYEVEANLDKNAIKEDFDIHILSKFRNKLGKKMGSRVPKFINEIFLGYILSESYENNYSKRESILLESFNIEILRAIYRYKQNN